MFTNIEDKLDHLYNKYLLIIENDPGEEEDEGEHIKDMIAIMLPQKETTVYIKVTTFTTYTEYILSYIPNFNKQLRYLNHSCQKKISVVGSAHNHQEVRIKKAQGCSQIFVSPLYPTSSHPEKKPMGIVKFNLLRNNFTPKINICPLGGVNESNIHKVRFFNFSGFALKSYLSKKQTQKSLGFLNLIARSNVMR